MFSGIFEVLEVPLCQIVDCMDLCDVNVVNVCLPLCSPLITCLVIYGKRYTMIFVFHLIVFIPE